MFRVRDGAVEDEWKLPQPADPPCPAFAALKPGSSPVGSGKLTWRSGNKVVGEAPLDGEAFVSGASLRPDTIWLRFPGFEEGRPISEFRIEPTAYCPDGGGVTWSCTEARCAIASVDYRFKGALPLSWPSAPSSAFAKKEPLADDRKQLERDAQGWVEEVRRMLSAACATHPCPAGLLQVQTAIGNGAPGFEAVEPIPFATFAPESTPKPEVHTWRARFRVEQGEVDLMHSDSDPDADDGVPGDWLLILKDGQELADYHRETPWDVPFSLRLRAGQHSLEITDDTEDDPLALKSEERLPTIIRWSFR